MSVIGGYNGNIWHGSTELGCVGRWSLQHTSQLGEYVCSASRGAKLRVSGNKDWTGSYEALGYQPAIMPGDAFTFEGSIDGEDVGASGTAIVDSVSITADRESAAPIIHVVNFSANSELALSCSGASVALVPIPYPSSDTKIEVAEGPTYASFADVPDVRSWTLTISRANPAYVSSGLPGQTQRVIGPLDCMLSFGFYADDADGWSGHPQPNDLLAVKCFVTSTLFYLIKWLQVSGMTGMDVDISTGAPVGGNIDMAFNGIALVSSTPTVGTITLPSTIAWWPPAP